MARPAAARAGEPVRSRPAGEQGDGASTAAGVPPILEARDLRKRFGTREALRGVSISAARGELVAVMGPNGAGKTTLLSILAGIQRPDAGTVGRTPREVGWVPQQPALYGKLTVAENLRLFARLEGADDVPATVERMLVQTGLADRANERVARLSGGNRQRVNVALGLVGSPPVLLLDEPGAALDPRQRERLWEFVEALAREAGTTVLYSTHDLAEAEGHAHRIVVLADGESVFAGTPGELVQAMGGREGGFEAAFVAFLHERGH
jgi:ABC-2 type transport system ATP-binding protein